MYFQNKKKLTFRPVGSRWRSFLLKKEILFQSDFICTQCKFRSYSLSFPALIRGFLITLSDKSILLFAISAYSLLLLPCVVPVVLTQNASGVSVFCSHKSLIIICNVLQKYKSKHLCFSDTYWQNDVRKWKSCTAISLLQLNCTQG